MRTNPDTTIGRRLLRDLPVGFVALFVILSAFIGPSQAASLFVLSIVCTAGIGMVVWGPVAILLGMTINALIRRFLPKEDEVSVRPTASQRRQMALRDYATRAAKRDRSHDDLVDLLLRNGWKPEDVDQGLADAGLGPRR